MKSFKSCSDTVLLNGDTYDKSFMAWVHVHGNGTNQAMLLSTELCLVFCAVVLLHHKTWNHSKVDRC